MLLFFSFRFVYFFLIGRSILLARVEAKQRKHLEWPKVKLLHYYLSIVKAV